MQSNSADKFKEMDENVRSRVREILTNYLVESHHRRTPERYAILDAVYEIDGDFSIDELGLFLEKKRFFVSRGTLYNTIHLLLDLRLVVRHSIKNNTRYEACYCAGSICRQVCTVCGKVTDVNAPKIVEAVEATKFRRFRKDGFSVHVYGVCSTCQGLITRKRGKEVHGTNKRKKHKNESRKG